MSDVSGQALLAPTPETPPKDSLEEVVLLQGEYAFASSHIFQSLFHEMTLH